MSLAPAPIIGPATFTTGSTACVSLHAKCFASASALADKVARIEVLTLDRIAKLISLPPEQNHVDEVP